MVSVKCYGVKESAEMTLAVQLEANLPAATDGLTLHDQKHQRMFVFVVQSMAIVSNEAMPATSPTLSRSLTLLCERTPHES